MEYKADKPLEQFKFWGGAKDHKFTNDELEQIESTLEEIYPDGMTETQVNDIFWFDEESLCEWAGIDFDQYLER